MKTMNSSISSISSISSVTCPAVARALSLLTLVTALSLPLSSPAARADEDVTCTLQRAIKVKVSGSFVTVDAGARVKVKVRKSDWSTVQTPIGDGITATKVLEQQCKPLPPRPAEPVGDDTPAKPPRVVKEKPVKPVKEKPVKVVKEKPVKPVKEKVVKGKKPTSTTGTAVVVSEVPLVDKPVVDAQPVVAVVEPVVVPVVVPVVEPAVVAEPVVAEQATVVEPAAVDNGNGAISVAVHTLEVGGADRRLGVLTTAAVRIELAKRLGVNVIDLVHDVEGRLGPEGLARLAVCPDDACVANIAAAVGADDVVVGSLRSESAGHSLELRRLQVLPLTTSATFVGSAVDDESTLRLASSAVDTLYAGRPRRDGTEPGPSTQLIARLTPPPVPPIATLAVAGVAVVGLGVTVAAVAVNQINVGQGREIASSSSLASPASGAELVALDQTVATSFAVFAGAGIATVVLGAGAVMMALFTDWDDLAGDPPAATPTSTTAPPATVTP